MPPSKTISFKGLGTYWECEILDHNLTYEKYKIIQTQILDRLDAFSSQYSRFNQDSLVSRLNQDYKIVDPPREMVKMFQFAQMAYKASEGIFDVTVGGILVGYGYGSTGGVGGIQSNFWDLVIISDQLIQIPKDTSIDFGGFGKGWLIDSFVDIFRKNNIKQFIINGGGDIFVQADDYINIKLEHPYDNQKYVGQTRIKCGALAASSIIKRTWQNGSNQYHHIIDPFKGESSNLDVVCSFIKADTALIADTMATILIVKPELDLKLSKQFNLKTILLTKEHF